MAKVAITLEQFRNTSIEELANHTEDELADILKQVRKSYMRQAKVLASKEDKYFSYALYRYLTTFGNTWDNKRNPKGKHVIEYLGQKYDLSFYNDTRVMSRNHMLQELAAMHTFFTAKTSTIPGIKQTNKESDIRIFGKNQRTGRPLRTMTAQERQKYWAVYDEFNRNPNILANSGLYGSNIIQNTIAEILKEGSINFLNVDFLALLNEVKNRIDYDTVGIEYTKWSGRPLFTSNGF